MNESNRHAPPRIYVASLADYNSGRLLARWIDAAQPYDAIRKDVAELLSESQELVAEDWAIHDYENFGGLRLSEFESLEAVAEIACLIVEHGPIFGELANHFGGTVGLDDAKRYMEEGYQGTFDSVRDYAEQFVEECYSDVLKGLPDFIGYHIDYDGIARDMELGGDIFTIECDGQVHVFWGNI